MKHRTWHFFDASGEYRGYFTGPERFLAANTPEGCVARNEPPETVAVPEVDPRTSEQARARARIENAEALQARAVREALLALLPQEHPSRERLQAIENAIAEARLALQRQDSGS